MSHILIDWEVVVVAVVSHVYFCRRYVFIQSHKVEVWFLNVFFYFYNWDELKIGISGVDVLQGELELIRIILQVKLKLNVEGFVRGRKEQHR